MNINIKFDKFSFNPLFEWGSGFDNKLRSEKEMTFDLIVITWLGINLKIEYNYKEYMKII